MNWLTDAAADARHAQRMLGKHLGFTIIVIGTLALGIGAATAIFTVVNRVLLSPLRYRDADRIVNVVTTFKPTGKMTPRLTGGDLVDIRKQAGVFETFSQYVGGEVGVQVSGRGDFTGAYWVNSTFFGVFGIAPLYGRLPDASDGEHAAVSVRHLLRVTLAPVKRLSAKASVWKIAPTK